MLRQSALALLTLVAALSACQNDKGTDQTVGTLGGAAAGGVVGSQFGHGTGNVALTGLGVLLGGWAGNEIGAKMDEDDKTKDRQAERRAYTAPLGQQITWNNPDSGHSGTIVPVHDGYSNAGTYCRDFQQTVTVSSQPQAGHDKACQQPDGSWKVVP